MENSLKGLILAAGIIITCVVVSLGFIIAREAKDTASNGVEQINMLNAEFAEGDKMLYDGVTVSGSEVLNVIRKYEGKNIGILVKTNKIETFYGREFNENTGALTGQTGKTYAEALEPTNDHYINPYGSFKGKVVRDANNVIVGLVFVQ